MLRFILFISLFLSQFEKIEAQNSWGAIGQWREHYNNKSVKDIIKGDKIYGATTNQVFSIDSKKNVELIGKSNGLNEIGIAAMAWDELNQQLIIAYNNSNIDILKGDNIYNINDILVSNLYANKKINSIKIWNGWALLSTNFGIVVVDLIKHEIKDTWFPNNNRQAMVTYQIALTTDSLYAITEEGLFSTVIKNNWIGLNGWNTLTKYNNLGLNKIVSNANTVIVYNSQSLFQLPSITSLYTTNATIHQVNWTAAGEILLTLSYASSGAVLKLNADKSTTVIIDSTQLLDPIATLADQNDLWVADSSRGLLLKNTSNQWISLDGPADYIRGKSFINATGLLAPFHGNANGFAAYTSLGWKNFTKYNSTNLPNCMASTIDPKDQSWWLTAKAALIHFNPNTNTIENSLPSNAMGDYVDLQFGSDGNLWVIQDQQGLFLKKDNVWTSYLLPNGFIKKGLSNMLVSKQGQVWMIAPQNQGLYMYQSTQVYNTAFWKQLTTAKSNGNLPSSHVTSLVEDLAGAIWVGTDNGIGILNCGDISKEICDAYLPPIKNSNGFIGLLFQKETVNCMAVDGANRKWIGTNNGTWLLSADGREIIEHFTKNNSPLPSDTLLQILIDPNQGEVFFNTNTEMVSYKGTATAGAKTQNEIAIYPNPVGPEYHGPIAFKGLVENAMVKITDLNGRLVFETRSLGGQAIWNGKTYEGQKVASGVYLVLVRDDAGNEKGVGKLVITSGL